MTIVYVLLSISMLIVLVQALTVLVLAIRLRKIEMVGGKHGKREQERSDGDDGILHRLAVWLIMLG
jgi:hypothetical protein